MFDVQATPGCSKPEDTKDLSHLQDKQVQQRRGRSQTEREAPQGEVFQHLLKVLQMSETALKTLSEKLTLTLTYFMLGSCRRSSLC